MNRFFVFLISIILAYTETAYAATKKYPVSEIPETLIKNSGAVVREDQSLLEITSINGYRLTHHYVVTLLKPNFVRLSRIYLPYSKFSKIRNISCVVYNAAVEKVKSLSADKIMDVSAIAGYSLFDDARMKIVDADYGNYPYTVDFDWEMNMDASLSYPQWNPYDEYQVAVQHSGLRVIQALNLQPLRYLERNGAPACIETSDKSNRTYVWEMNQLPAVKDEPFSGDMTDYLPVVFLAPSDFTIDGFDGNLESWEKMGSWNYSLLQGRDALPETTKAQILDLVKDAATDHEKICLIYSYLQKKVRYVNLSLGIGGWQPIEAQQTDKVSYGDCKGLSYYMKSLLEVAGISSLYTLVSAGSAESDVMSEFPSQQFNHAMLCVPQEKDTVWLECTNQRIPCGYLGNFTDDRYVLLTTDKGGVLSRSPVYSSDVNRFVSNTKAILDASGNLSVINKTSHQGYFYDLIDNVLGMDEHDRKEFVLNTLSIPRTELQSYAFTQCAGEPEIIQDLAFGVKKYASLVNNQLVIRPNILNRGMETPYPVSNRLSKLRLRREWLQTDTVSITLPEKTRLGKLPTEIVIDTDFGHYSAQFLPKDNQLIYVRKFLRHKGLFEADKYQDFVAFYDKIRRADEVKISVILP